MSKCRPEAGLEFAAITDFLRSVHINGKPLELPKEISAVHIHPRLTMNLAKTVTTESFEKTATVFDAAESVSTQIQKDVHSKIETLDKRIDEILKRLEKGKQ